MPGKRIHKTTTIKTGTMKGIHAAATLSSGLRLNLASTNRELPNGGVSCPIHRTRHIITPKASLLKPVLLTTGTKIGAKSKIAGVVPMKQPITSRKSVINSNIRVALFVV